MKKYDILKSQVEQITEANAELKDSKLSLMLRMLESTEKRIKKLEEEKLINTPGNTFYPRAYVFYATAAMIRLDLLNGVSKDYYQIPGFNTWEDIDNIFEGFTPQFTVGIYSDQYELPEKLTGSYVLTENGLKIIFVNSAEELAALKKENTIVLHITNLN